MDERNAEAQAQADMMSEVEPEISVGDMVNELIREQEMRSTVYPTLIQRGKLSQGEADRRFKIVDAIIVKLKALM